MLQTPGSVSEAAGVRSSCKWKSCLRCRFYFVRLLAAWRPCAAGPGEPASAATGARSSCRSTRANSAVVLHEPVSCIVLILGDMFDA